jgi:hypothetical protein
MLASMTLTGVFIADQPLDVNEGCKGDQVLEITLPAEIDLADFEIVEDHKGYREWCVPAAVINGLTERSE